MKLEISSERIDSTQTPYEDFLMKFKWLERAEKQKNAQLFPPEQPLFLFGEDKLEKKENQSATTTTQATSSSSSSENKKKFQKQSKEGKYWFCGSVPAFTKYVFSREPKQRNGYSVVSESEKVFGFFDLEFARAYNQQHNVNKMLKNFFKYFALAWSNLIDSSVKVPTEEDFVQLSASNEKKESFHIHGPFYVAFKNVYHLRTLVIEMERLMKRRLSELKKQASESALPGVAEEIEELEQMSVKTKPIWVKTEMKQVQTTFVDSAVYHHHCGLRAYGCSKLDEYRPLKLHHLGANVSTTPLSDEKLFELSIINNIPSGTPVTTVNNEQKYQAALPESALKRIREAEGTAKPVRKQSYFLFKLPKVAEQEATHYELTGPVKHYRLVKSEDLATVFKGITKSFFDDKVFHCSYELLDKSKLSNAKLAFDFVISAPEAANQQLYTTLGTAVLESAAAQGITQQETATRYLVIQFSPVHFRIVFPGIALSFSQLETLLAALTTTATSSIAKIENVHEKGEAALVGSIVHEDTKSFIAFDSAPCFKVEEVVPANNSSGALKQAQRKLREQQMRLFERQVPLTSLLINHSQ